MWEKRGFTAVYQLIYQSSCRTGTTLDVLRDIAKRSAATNAEAGITGVMLVHGKDIVQVLEGDKAAVRKLYHRISTDRRHGGCRVLLTCESDTRAFGDWKMGVCEVTDDDTDLFRLAVATIKARDSQKRRGSARQARARSA